MREPSSCGIRRREGETGAGHVALVWNYILQPSARPQGVPVGPQSTCHALDRGVSTLWFTYPLGLKGPPRPQEGAVIGRTRQRTRAANLLNSDRGDNNIPPSAVRRPHPPPMPYRQTHADRSLATVPVSPSSPPHFPELGRFSTTRYDIPLAVPLPAAPAVGAPVTTRILS